MQGGVIRLLLAPPDDWPFLLEYKSFQAEAESTVSSFVAADAEIPGLGPDLSLQYLSLWVWFPEAVVKTL